ncbi:aspartate kinase [Calocera viscosa TUFC12733]|uniref:aspartate kinase n=1 Tax=Calocera viscosa (strain TUFC12733) TaxID=1330018 RepID=A0A167HUE8_CALVF|nr:aspartate kinase [Calocera viscosa TUFC12733]
MPTGTAEGNPSVPGMVDHPLQSTGQASLRRRGAAPQAGQPTPTSATSEPAHTAQASNPNLDPDSPVMNQNTPVSDSRASAQTPPGSEAGSEQERSTPPALFSVYRLLSTAALLGLGMPKAILTFQALSTASNDEQQTLNIQAEAFDVTAGVGFALLQMWVGYFEADHGPHWFWHYLFDVDVISFLWRVCKYLASAIADILQKISESRPPYVLLTYATICNGGMWVLWATKAWDDANSTRLFWFIWLTPALSYLPPEEDKQWIEARAGAITWQALEWTSTVLPCAVGTFSWYRSSWGASGVAFSLVMSLVPVSGALLLTRVFPKKHRLIIFLVLYLGYSLYSLSPSLTLSLLLSLYFIYSPSIPKMATPNGLSPQLRQNPPASPSAPWLIQKFGGTSVGKFASTIAEDIVPRYMSTHRVAVVCSARSGSTKSLGTTNLLLRAASEALRSPTSGISSSTPGTPGPGVQGPIFQNGGALSGFSTPVESERGRSLSLASVRGLTSLEGAEQPQRDGTASPSPFHPLPSTSFFSASARKSSAPEPPAFHTTIDLLYQEHIAAARSVIRGEPLLAELEEEIGRDCEGLKMFLQAAQVIDEISPRSKDSIVGVGERLACKLIAAALQDRGIDAEFVSLENIVPASLHESSDAYGERSVRLEQPFYDEVAKAVAARIEACGRRVPVVTGFFGPVPNSLLTQIGRGYTDLLAALLAAGLHPATAELQIWKEVDGIFTADPRKVPTARLLEVIYPEEAKELTYYGSEVVHPFVMDQVMRMAIPIRIKNVENPTGPGTIISPELPSPPSTPGGAISTNPNAAPPRRLPTAVTIKDNIIILNVASTGRKTSTHGFLASIFGILDRWGVTVDLVSTSEVHVSMALEDFTAGSGGRRMRDRLVAELSKIGQVTLTPSMAILSLVGSQMRHMVGISGRMFTTLAEGNINIEMISQGANEINISCVIDGREAVKALNLIHMSCLQVKPDGLKGRMGPWLY